MRRRGDSSRIDLGHRVDEGRTERRCRLTSGESWSDTGYWREGGSGRKL